jgi:bacterioferritin-associated ferredoxin
MKIILVHGDCLMYVCLCHGVTDGQIRQAVENGAKRMRDLYLELGVATDCAKCACCAKEVLQDALAQCSAAPLPQAA